MKSSGGSLWIVVLETRDGEQEVLIPDSEAEARDVALAAEREIGTDGELRYRFVFAGPVLYVGDRQRTTTQHPRPWIYES